MSPFSAAGGAMQACSSFNTFAAVGRCDNEQRPTRCTPSLGKVPAGTTAGIPFRAVKGRQRPNIHSFRLSPRCPWSSPSLFTTTSAPRSMLDDRGLEVSDMTGTPGPLSASIVISADAISAVCRFLPAAWGAHRICSTFKRYCSILRCSWIRSAKKGKGGQAAVASVHS